MDIFFYYSNLILCYSGNTLWFEYRKLNVLHSVDFYIVFKSEDKWLSKFDIWNLEFYYKLFYDNSFNISDFNILVIFGYLISGVWVPSVSPIFYFNLLIYFFYIASLHWQHTI